MQRDVLRGIHASLQGQRQLQAPPGWAEAAQEAGPSPDAEVREKTLLLSVLFGDAGAVASLRHTAADPPPTPATRRTALQTLVEAHAPDLLPLLRELLNDRRPAPLGHPGPGRIRDPADAGAAARTLPPPQRRREGRRPDDVVARGPSTPGPAGRREAGKVPSQDLSPFTVRQMLSLKNATLTEKIGKVWGTSGRPT